MTRPSGLSPQKTVLVTVWWATLVAWLRLQSLMLVCCPKHERLFTRIHLSVWSHEFGRKLNGMIIENCFEGKPCTLNIMRVGRGRNSEGAVQGSASQGALLWLRSQSWWGSTSACCYSLPLGSMSFAWESRVVDPQRIVYVPIIPSMRIKAQFPLKRGFDSRRLPLWHSNVLSKHDTNSLTESASFSCSTGTFAVQWCQCLQCASCLRSCRMLKTDPVAPQGPGSQPDRRESSWSIRHGRAKCAGLRHLCMPSYFVLDGSCGGFVIRAGWAPAKRALGSAVPPVKEAWSPYLNRIRPVFWQIPASHGDSKFKNNFLEILDALYRQTGHGETLSKGHAVTS